MPKAEIGTRRWRKLRERILARDNYTCQRCQSTENLQVDHIISRVDGGQNNEDNLQVLCKLCNLNKGRKSGFLSVKATPPFLFESIPPLLSANSTDFDLFGEK